MKIDNQEYLELQGNEFFQIIFFVSEQTSGPEWLARVYCGTRKLITIASPKVGADIPISGSEITYSTLEFSSQESLNKFLDCDETQATILD